MQIIVSDTFSPSFNLASEEFLLTERPCDVLFFYINAPCVVLGRNQNIYAEVNIPYCISNNIRIVRRLSGGGTVFHDKGNINFCFISAKTDKPLDYNPLNQITDALASLHIPATTGARKDLYLNQKKITGTAMHSRGSQALFHGTLLFDTQLDTLEAALTSPYSTVSKAVKSIRSNVTNIKHEIANPAHFNSTGFLHTMINYFEQRYNTQAVQLSLKEKASIEKLRKNRYESWEWNWAQNPKCTIHYQCEARTQLVLTIEKGIISTIHNDTPDAIQAHLLNKRFNELL